MKKTGNKILTVLLGVTLVVDGVQNLWMVLYTVRSKKAEDESIDIEIIE